MGRATSPNGDQVPVEIRLKREGDAWKVRSVRLTRAGDAEADGTNR